MGIAAGEGEGGLGDGAALTLGIVAELVEEVQEVIGVLAGGIEADGEGDGAWRRAMCSRRWRSWA
jgi:hypothetical protein